MTDSQAIDFVDTETTGLIDDYPEAEITEIAIVQWQDGDTKVKLHTRVRPKRKVPDDISKYNKSWNAELNMAEDAWDAEASRIVSGMLRGAYICGSNPDFDKKMITAECFRTGEGRPQWGHRGVNTCSMGMMLWLVSMTEGAGLGHLTKYFNIEHEAHTALGDCMAAIKVFEAFFDLFIFRPKLMREALEEIEAGAYSRFGAAGINKIVELAGAGLRGGL